MRNLLFLLALCAFISCENLLIKDLEIEDFDFEKQLVVQAELNSNSDSLRVFVSENASILETVDNINFIDDAVVKLYYEGVEIADLALGPDKLYYHYFQDQNRPSGNYELRVNNPKYGEATSTTIIPADVEVKDITINIDAGYDPLEMSNVHELAFTIKDAPGRDFYSFELFGEPVLDTFIYDGDTIIEAIEPYIYPTMSTDPSLSISQFSDEVFIDDSFFDGKEYTIRYRFVVYNVGVSATELAKALKLKLTVHSEDSYLYKSSLDAYFSSEDFGPFSEPVSVHTNIENGLGIFAGLNTRIFGF